MSYGDNLSGDLLCLFDLLRLPTVTGRRRGEDVGVSGNHFVDPISSLGSL